VKYGQITGRFVQYVADTGDASNVPDEIPLEGTVTLTPLTKVIQFPTTTPPRMAVATPVEAMVVAGNLVSPSGGALYVIATDQTAGVPPLVQWQATFSFNNVDTQPAPVTFNVPGGGVVDLALAISIPATPPAVIVVSHDDATAAAASASAANTSKLAAAASATAADASKVAAATSATNAAAAATKLLSGTGFPVGVVAAPIGTMYQDLAATNGAVLWIKTSGTAGNTTGWSVAYGDTGYRDITSLVTNGWAATRLDVRRIGYEMHFRARVLNGSAATSSSVLAGGALPTGFVVGYGQGAPFAGSNTLYTDTSAGLQVAGTAYTAVNTSSQARFGLAQTTPWPPVLPGTPSANQ